MEDGCGHLATHQLWVTVEAVLGEGAGDSAKEPSMRDAAWGPLVQPPPLPALPLRVTPHANEEGKDQALAHSPIPVC